MISIRSFASLLACVAVAACAPPDVSVPPPTTGAPQMDAGAEGEALGNDPEPGAAGDASGKDQGLVDGPGDRGGLGKEAVVMIRAEFLCADQRIGADEAARTQAHAEIIAQHGTQQKWLDQVLEDIKEEPDLDAQLQAKIKAKAAELCPAGGTPPAAADVVPDTVADPAKAEPTAGDE